MKKILLTGSLAVIAILLIVVGVIWLTRDKSLTKQDKDLVLVEKDAVEETAGSNQEDTTTPEPVGTVTKAPEVEETKEPAPVATEVPEETEETKAPIPEETSEAEVIIPVTTKAPEVTSAPIIATMVPEPIVTAAPTVTSAPATQVLPLSTPGGVVELPFVPVQ